MTLTRRDAETRASASIRIPVKQIVVATATVIASAGLVAFAANSGGTLEQPVDHRVYEIGIIAVAVAILVFGIWQSVRAGRSVQHVVPDVLRRGRGEVWGSVSGTAMRLVNLIPALPDAPSGMISALDLPLLPCRNIVDRAEAAVHD